MGLSKLLLRGCTRNGFCHLGAARRSSNDVTSAAAAPGGCPGTGEGGGQAAVVVGVYEDGGRFELSDVGKELDQRGGGKLSRQLSEAGRELAAGRATLVTEPADGVSAAALAPLGPREARYCPLEALDERRENVRAAVGAAVALLAARGAPAVAVDTAGAPSAAAEGATLAAWRFMPFRSDRAPPPALAPLGAPDEGWERGAVRARAQNWARYLSDMPANRLTPTGLAQEALDALCPLGVRVEARDRTWIEAQGMRALLAVARGSCEEPVFLEAAWLGGGGAAPVLLAAKGVTFDSGGLCLKKADSLTEKRGSMAGAAVALGAMRALAELKVPLNVRCVIPMCENMVSGQCMKVGDVVTALNGLSIQIEDTDMEGRLMLADALVFGQAQYKPALVVDVATLTRGVLQALGGGAFGCFSSSEEAWRGMRAAGARSGDRAWRFPLWGYYGRQITNEPAVDLRNKGSGKATPCLGAAFLRNFVCCEWVHMDITGVGLLAHSRAPPYLDARRMTGRPTRTLVHFLCALCGGGTAKESADIAPPRPCPEDKRLANRTRRGDGDEANRTRRGDGDEANRTRRGDGDEANSHHATHV